MRISVIIPTLNEADNQPGPRVLFGHSLGTVTAYVLVRYTFFGRLTILPESAC